MGWISGGIWQEDLFPYLNGTVFVESLVKALTTSRFSLALTYYREEISVARLRHPGVSVPGYIEVSLEGDPDDGWCILVQLTDIGFNRTRPDMRFYRTNGPDRKNTVESVLEAINAVISEG